MKKRKYALLMTALSLSVCSGYAQKKELTTDALESISTSYKHDAYTKAMQNALSHTDVNKIAENDEVKSTVDHHFKYKVGVSGITDQQHSGRCWMFTSLNRFRPDAMGKLDLSEFEFSQDYLFFWDLLEKSNLFLNNVIETTDQEYTSRRVEFYFKSPVSDGGVWNLFVNLVKKYGVVPKSVQPETHSSNNTTWMSKILNRKLREDGVRLRNKASEGAKDKELLSMKDEMMKDIYRILALNLGEPVKEFKWRATDNNGNLLPEKTYTPQSFRDEVIGKVEWDDYVMIMNDPTRPYYEYYEIENYRNVEEGRNWTYINLPNDVIKKFAVASIKNNEAMYTSCDVGKQLNRTTGILDVHNYDYESVYGMEFGMDKKERILSKESGSSHAMLLMAVDVDNNEKPIKWQFENSWGADTGHNGYLTFTDEWFDNYLFRIVIRKEYLDQKTLDILKHKPTILPPWDPMF